MIDTATVTAYRMPTPYPRPCDTVTDIMWKRAFRLQGDALAELRACERALKDAENLQTGLRADPEVAFWRHVVELARDRLCVAYADSARYATTSPIAQSFYEARAGACAT